MQKIEEIEIFEHTFNRLKEQANPAELKRAETMDAVINRALDALVEMSREVNDTLEGPGEMPREERRIDPEALPKMTHTKVLDAAIDGEKIKNPKWNNLLHRMIVRSRREISDFEAFWAQQPVRFPLAGKKIKHGTISPKLVCRCGI